jgi:tyrosine-specific transport protein
LDLKKLNDGRFMELNILQERRISLKKVISGTSLIAGTTIGAGMLGIPLVTSQAGFFPAICATVCVWAFMVLTGLLYVEVALSLPRGANIFSMAGHYMGTRGKVAAGGMFLFLYYCLLVAYIAGGAPLFGFLLNTGLGIELGSTPVLLLFGLLFGGVVWLGAKAIDRVTLILSVAMISTYIALVTLGSSEVSIPKLAEANWPKICLALPVLFSAFGYHNVVPSLCTYLDRDRKSLKVSILCGTGIALAVFLAWQWLILGSLPQESIQSALAAGQPVTAALQSLTGRNSLFAIGQGFAFFALVTSFLGVAFSVVDFLNDGLNFKGKKRPLLIAMTFVPPALCAFLKPAIFETALGVAGGFGEAFLNGLLPVVLAWKYRTLSKGSFNPGPISGRGVLVALFGFGLFVMGLEIFFLT